ncbi:MAG: methyltransferase domain-containing protein [Proteobacteria bacterium]|nr:methyltransferase domain-containing protein [Pseudomonadota bacterium]
MRLSILAALLTALAAACSPGVAQQAPSTASAFPAPDRPVAEIVSPVWLNEADRDKARESEQVVQLMGIAPGMAVADIGAGTGYHTVRLSPVVGPRGRVYAQDVTPEYLADLERRLEGAELDNITTLRGAPDDPRLPPRSLDAAILIHMYHEIAQPYAFMHRLAGSMKPGARVGVVDLDRATWLHGTPRDLLRCELEAVGYRQISSHQLTGGVGYLAIFEPPAAPIEPSAIRACKGQKPPGV